MTGQASTLDRTSALRIAEQASRKAIRLRAVLEGAGDDLSAFVRLVRAWASGTYRDVPWRSMALVVGALVYFLNPLDAVPDPLPSVGLVFRAMGEEAARCSAPAFPAPGVVSGRRRRRLPP
jgi:hypothetical protein